MNYLTKDHEIKITLLQQELFKALEELKGSQVSYNELFLVILNHKHYAHFDRADGIITMLHPVNLSL